MTRSLVLALTISVALCGPLRAQQSDFRTKLRIDDSGRLFLQHDSDSDAHEARPVFDRLPESVQNGGIAGYLGFVLTGATDYVSTIHAESFLGELDLASEEDLEQTITNGLADGATPWQKNLGLLAARAADERGLGKQFARLDEFDLPPVRELPPLSEALAKVPSVMSIVGVVHQDQLPPSHVGRAGTILGRMVTMDVLEDSGEDVEALPPDALLSAEALAQGPSVFPFEWARRVGNFRVQRSVIGARPFSTGLLAWVRHEGSFEVEAWASEFDNPFYDVTRTEDGFVATSTGSFGLLSFKLECTATTLVLATILGSAEEQFSRETIGAEGGADLAEIINREDGLTVLIVSPFAPELEVPPQLVPTRVTLRSITTGDAPRSHHVRLTWSTATDEQAAAVHGLIAPVLDSVSDVEVDHRLDGATVEVDLDLSDLLDTSTLRMLFDLLGS